jgi:rhodanese-related sulfurtransferase
METVIIDVREPGEYAGGHVEGAINIPPAAFLNGADDKLHDIPKDAPIVVYCHTGSRSNVVMHLLKNMGYKNVVNGINKDHVNAKYRR